MLKMIRQFTFHHPKQIIAPTLWLFLSQAFSILPAILAYMAIYLLGQAFYPPYTLDIALLIKIAIIGIAYVLLQYAVELISYYNTYGRAYHDTADKRITYIQKLRRQNLGFFSSKESGELISSFASDFANVEYTMCFWLPYPIGIGFLLLLSFVCMLFFDWRMAVAIFAMLPICTILMLQIAKVKEKHSRSVMEAKTRAATQLNEYLHGMKDLKAYHRTGSGFEALKKAFSDLRRESLLDEAVAGSLSTLCASLVKFVVPVTATVGLYLLMGGSLTILDFAGFLVIATKLTEPALTLVSSISALRGMALSGERLDKVMTMPDPSGEDKISHGDSYAFDSVSFHYAADSNVIHGVSFETPAGALTALVGPSGSGKSTLLRLMARFWDYQQGQVRFAGKELRSIAPESLLSQVSMVMQNAYLFRGTIRENLCFGNECITEQQMLDACRKARCHDFVSALPEGYDTVVGEGGATLSGGERQRISLARAFLKDVPILLLDEPTLLEKAQNGEPIRVWVGRDPDDVCGLYWLLEQLRPIGFEKLDITIVELPMWETRPDGCIVQYNGWGEVEPYHLGRMASLGKKLPTNYLRSLANRWRELQQENSPLRAVINGKLVSVSETLYDTFILRELDTLDDEFKESVLVGQVLGKNQLGIGDGWIALRVEQFIKEGLLIPITTPAPNAPIYHRMLKKIK